MMDEQVVIRTFLYRHEAGIALGLLKSNGIEAVISSDDCGGYRPHLNFGFDNVQILVHSDDAQKAKEILQVLDSEPDLSTTEHLDDVALNTSPEPPKKKKKDSPLNFSFVIPLLIVGLFALTYAVRERNRSVQKRGEIVDVRQMNWVLEND